MAGQTLYDKLWQSHVVVQRDDGSALIYIDRHLIHEVTSPQAFEGLRLAGRPLWRRDANLAVPDHNVPTEREERSGGVAAIADPISRLQVQTLDDNCRDYDIVEFEINDRRQGIVHVVGPGAGRDPAGHDRGVRGFPYLHPRRPRRPGPRHRHLRGGARAGHPVPDPAEDEEHAGAHRRLPAERGDGERCGTGGHRQNRHRRGQRLRDRVRR